MLTYASEARVDAKGKGQPLAMGGRLEGKIVCMLLTNDLSADARVQKEAQTLASAGAVVTVVGVGAAGAWKPPPSYSLRLVQRDGASTARLRAVRVWQNLKGDRRLEVRLRDAAKALSPDVIHCNDLDTLWAGLSARSRGSRVVYDSHEVFTEMTHVEPWRRKWLRAREQRLIKKADAVVTVNRHIAAWLQSRYGLDRVPEVVMNGPSECLTGAAPVGSPVRLLFQGYLGRDRNVGAMIRAVSGLGGRAVLTLQGWGGVEAELRVLVEEQGLAGVVRFVEPCAPHETVRAAAEHDVGLIAHRPDGLNNLYSSPNKLFDYVGAGLAVVASDIPVMRDIVGESGCGLLFDPQDEDALRAAIATVVSDAELVSDMKARSSRLCADYAWPVQGERLLHVYEEVT